MFKAIKDSWFFSKMSTIAMDHYGIDMMKADRATEGLINASCKEQRHHGFTPHEAAAACVAITMLSVVQKINPEHLKPDYSKIMEVEKTILMMSSQGLIRDSVLEYVRGITDRYFDVIEEITGVPFQS